MSIEWQSVYFMIYNNVDGYQKYKDILQRVIDFSRIRIMEPNAYQSDIHDPPRIVLSISSNCFGEPGGFPLKPVQELIRPLYEVELDGIAGYMTNYGPDTDIEQEGWLTPDEFEMLDEFCYDKFGDCWDNYWVFTIYYKRKNDPYELFTPLTEQLLQQMEHAEDPDQFFNGIELKTDQSWWYYVQQERYKELDGILPKLLENIKYDDSGRRIRP